ncbi:hypothetical protein [Fusobacterium animalis]|uniref:hypothetical protein n=1 Tax=Fusobacterium animalis TaxID=76859 RepID=UPI0030CD5C6F
MKKILLIDQLGPEGHINYDKFWIKALANLKIEYTFVGKKNFLDKLGIPDNIKKLEIPENYCKNTEHKNIIIREYALFKILNYVKRALNLKYYDKIIFLSFENFSLFFSFNFHKNNVYAILHNNLRRVNNSKVLKVLKYLSKKINLISLDYYIQKGLNSIGINTKVIIHPLVKISESIDPEKNDKIVLFSPSISSTDKTFINDVINDKGILKILEEKNIEIIFRSKNTNYNSNNIKVISEYLSENKYRKLLKESDYLLLPYEKNFNYRISGVLLEGISLNKKMIIPKYNDLKYFLSFNKESILGFFDLNDFKSLLEKLDKNINMVNYEEIKKIYSDENMEKDIINILND